MDQSNKPRSREKKVVSGGSGAFRRGEGLGTGPVGMQDGYAGKGTGTSSGDFGQRDTGTRSLPMSRIIIILLVVLLGGGGGASGLFSSLLGGGADMATQTAAPQTTQTSTYQGSESPSGTDTGAGTLNTEVVRGARAKRTQILGNGQDTATIMVYMCGTDLESKNGMATADINEMLSASFSDKINLVIYTGGCARWRNTTISNRTNQIWQVRDGELLLLEDNLGSLPMTSPDTLSSFIQYCGKNFPANRNSLIFWDHGGGSVSGYGYDEKYASGGGMTLAGIKDALTKGGMTFDWIGFDACLMATVENALMLDEFADYLIASEETEPGIGWYYTNWLTEFSRNTSMSTPELGKIIIDEFVRACNVNCRGQKTTLSIIDLAELSHTVPEKLNAFSKSISALIRDKEYKTVSQARYQTREFAQNTRIDQVDLVHLAQNMGTPEGKELSSALQSAVKYNRTSSNISNAYGVSIYFPYQRTSYVDKAVNTYDQIGMDEDYAACIREFAAIETSGQVIAGGSQTGSPVPSLLGTLMQGQGGGSADMFGQLLNSFMGGGASSGLIEGLSAGNIGFMSGRAMPDEELYTYLEDNRFDASALFWQMKDGEYCIPLTDEQWDLVHSLTLNMFYDDGEGYIDLGLDNVFDIDEEGALHLPSDRTWLSIGGSIVAYYWLDTVEDGDNYTITGRVPAFLNGERVNLILVFDQDTPYGYIAGAVTDYTEKETETVAKSMTELAEGDTLEFICDYYSYEGVYRDSYLLGDAVTYTEDIEIANMDVGRGDALISFRFTDLYNQEYWSESFVLE
ncbi:MAG: peptidase C11 [Lachnospiraceae bacterium]|nr:peptidase C11 [Lachnospiraceae bacterium]